MTTQALMSEKRLHLSIPIGGGLRRTVEIPGDAIDPTLMIAGGEIWAGSGSYLRMADTLLQGDTWSPRRVFLTSPIPEGGTTCTAFNLAWALSQRGKSVLLVELNFRHPRFLKSLGNVQIRYGVDSAIRGSTDTQESVIAVGQGGLNLSPVRNATGERELKQHLPSLASFLDWASEHHDWLVLDCPPVLSHEWNEWFREHAEPAALVVRDNATTLAQIRKAAKRLGSGMKGVLLNAAGDASDLDYLTTGDPGDLQT
jgi:Mrp family chromosome partitioning ATPase